MLINRKPDLLQRYFCNTSLTSISNYYNIKVIYIAFKYGKHSEIHTSMHESNSTVALKLCLLVVDGVTHGPGNALLHVF